MSYTICAIVQKGRLEYEAVLFLESFTRTNPDFAGRVMFLEPAQNDLWDQPTQIDADIRTFLTDRGAGVVPFESKQFGSRYPHGNKIEALAAVPTDQPFVFFDTDTLFTGDIGQVAFDFDRPTASMKRTNTWPKADIEGYSADQIWASLYRKFNLDFDASLNHRFADWQRYLYFNAGWFFYSDAGAFHRLFAEYAAQIETDPPAELAGQSLNPWLDQVTLPLVIHALGGDRGGAVHGFLDGSVSHHYRTLPLLFAKGTDAQVQLVNDIAADAQIGALLSHYDPFDQMLYQGKGARARELGLAMNGADEGKLRRALRDANLWYR